MERRSPDPEPPPESKLPQDPIPVLPEEDNGCCAGNLVIVSEGSPESGQLCRVRLRNREFEVCSRSLYIFPLRSCVRRRVIELVTWWAFDKFILFLIFFNSICLASYDHRSESNSGFNWVSDNIFDPILTSFFTLEFILKVVAFGFVVDKTSYLRDAWNWLDFIVVVTGVLQMTNAITSQEGVGFLRMFRILRPLRSLNAVPQMKVLVNTVLSSIPRLGNVSIMAAFLFVSFGIVGVSLFGGVFYRGCHTIPKPILIGANGTECWSWPFTGEERLCGGRYLCEDGPGGSAGFCGGHEQDTDKALRPVFDGGRQGFPWCQGSAPFKVFPESEWICFDHMGSALITIFQCMTLEGWTDVMYRIQDGHGMVVATVYFFLLIPITSFFLLNVALAVVDEAREDFAEEAADEAAQEEAEERELRAKLEEEAVESKATATHAGHDGAGHPDHPSNKPASLMGQLVDAAEDVTRAMSKALDEEVEDDEAPWWDVAPVRVLLAIATNEVFTNTIMCFI
ncbi:Cacna1c, partial [Symbiodinium sp. CCMP2456]